MSQFFKFLFASCLGFLLAISAVMLISTAVFSAMASQAEKPQKMKPNSVLHLTFEQPVPELTNNAPISPFATNFDDPGMLGLQDMVDAIERGHERNLDLTHIQILWHDLIQGNA